MPRLNLLRALADADSLVAQMLLEHVMPEAQLESEEQPAPASWPAVAGAEHVPAVSLPAGTEQDPTQTLSKWIETCESL